MTVVTKARRIPHTKYHATKVSNDLVLITRYGHRPQYLHWNGLRLRPVGQTTLTESDYCAIERELRAGRLP